MEVSVEETKNVKEMCIMKTRHGSTSMYTACDRQWSLLTEVDTLIKCGAEGTIDF